MNDQTNDVNPEQRPQTAPQHFQVSIRGFDTKEKAEEFGYFIIGYVRELSRYINLSGLDGLTVAFD
jgi:hypothetical protein